MNLPIQLKSGQHLLIPGMKYYYKVIDGKHIFANKRKFKKKTIKIVFYHYTLMSAINIKTGSVFTFITEKEALRLIHENNFTNKLENMINEL